MQPVSGQEYTTIGTGVGTTVVHTGETVLDRIIIPGTHVGTLKIHDALTAAGTSATTLLFTLGLPLTSLYQSFEFGARLKNGLVYESTGTPVVTLIWH